MLSLHANKNKLTTNMNTLLKLTLTLLVALGMHVVGFGQNVQELKNKIGSSSGLQKASFELQLANLLSDDEPDNSISYAKDALDIGEEFGNKTVAASASAILANTYFVKKKYDKSINYGKDAASYFKSTDQENYAMVEGIIADAYEKKGNKKESITHNKKSYTAFSAENKHKQAAYCASGIGLTYNKMGKTKDAIAWYEKAAKKFNKAGKENDEVKCLSTIGALYSNYGDYKASEKALQKALQKAEEYNLSKQIKKIEKSLEMVNSNETVDNSTGFQKEQKEEQENYISMIENKHAKSLAEIENMSEEMQLAALKEKAALDDAKLANAEKEKAIAAEELANSKAEQLNAEKAEAIAKKESAEAAEKAAKAAAEAESIKGQRLLIGLGALGIIAFLILLAFLGKRKSNKALQAKNAEILKQKEEITLQHDEILEQSKNIQQSIDYATRIQQSVLPSHSQFGKVTKNSFIYLNPKDHVSGDFFWYHEIGSQVIVIAADCTGHGVPGAFMSIIFSTILDKVVADEKITSPSAILESICAILTSKLLERNLDNSEFKDGMDVSVINYNRATKTILFSGARNHSYLVQSGELTELKATRRSVGVLTDKPTIPFEETSVKVASGDRVYMFSDGFPDQKGGEKGKKYYYKPFKEMLKNLGSKKPENHPTEIANEFNKWKGDKEQFDDVMVIGFEID